MKKIYNKTILGFIAMLCLAGCSSIENSSSVIPSTQPSNATTSPSESTSDDIKTDKAIVVYFSATRHTENVANYIANHIHSAIFSLEPVEPYTSTDLNWSNSNSRVVTEHNDPNRHVELKNVTFDGFDKAECVFLGAPVWWQELSWVVDDFVKLNDFSGKTIIPFATSSSSSYSVTNLEAITTNATWLLPQRFSSNVSESMVTSWVDGLNLSL